MSNEVREAASGRKSAFLSVLLPLALYLAVGVPCANQFLERLNSDGVCYLHRAVLLSHGDFHNAVTGYWSPLLIWTTVPLLKLGVDPLHAIHWTLFTWGAVYVLSTMMFLQRLLPGRIVWRTIAACAVAIAALRLTLLTITPDVILGAILLAYFNLAAPRELSMRRAFLTGAVGGLAYLAKAYALPFFFAHFAISLAMRNRRGRTALLGLAGFTLIAGPWITALSIHYGRPTFSTATARNRFMGDVAPSELAAHPPDVSRLPPGPFISNMEVTDADNWPTWSPFDSRRHFTHQLAVIWRHVGRLCADVWRFDYIGLTFLAAILMLWRGRRTEFPLRMLLLAAVIYGGGLTLVAYETRYVLPVLLPIAIALCLRSIEGIQLLWPGIVLAGIFVIGAVVGASPIIESEPRITYREMAERMQTAGLEGTFVSNTWNRDRPSCLAFFLNRKFIAFPFDANANTLQAKLDAAGVSLFTYWYDPLYADSMTWPERQARVMLRSGNWARQLTVHLDGKRKLEIYRRKPGSATTQSSE